LGRSVGTSPRASPQIVGKRVWRAKSTGGEELLASPIQGEYFFQGEIATLEVCITIEEDKGWIPTTREVLHSNCLPTIFQHKFSFLNMCQILMHRSMTLEGGFLENSMMFLASMCRNQRFVSMS
jgi:hypothetical protein